MCAVLLTAGCGSRSGGLVDGGADSSSAGTSDGSAEERDGGGNDGARATPIALLPAPGAQGVCPDPSLRLTFAGRPILGTAGKVQVWDPALAAMPVVSVDLAVSVAPEVIGGITFNLPRQVYVDGNDAIVHLPARALGYGRTYYVTVESGAILDASGVPVVVTDASTWRFSTVAAAPSNLTSVTVASDGSAEFCSVQGGIDAVPAGNTTAAIILVGAGTYREVVYFAGKNNLTLRGADRARTIIAAINNNSLNPTSRGRSLVGIDNSAGVVIENLTIQNLTVQGGSQAEALRLGQCDKCIVRDANILSLQDTLQWSGRIYARNLLVAGNVDFIWGTGVAYFKDSELRTVGRSGYNVQARNAGSTANGYVFVDSKVTSDPGVTGGVLARVDVSAFPFSHVAYINCELGPHISPAGWLITGAGTVPPPVTLRFWEFESRDPQGNLIDISRRVPGSTQLTADQAAMMRDPSLVLGGWLPE